MNTEQPKRPILTPHRPDLPRDRQTHERLPGGREVLTGVLRTAGFWAMVWGFSSAGFACLVVFLEQGPVSLPTLVLKALLAASALTAVATVVDLLLTGPAHETPRRRPASRRRAPAAVPRPQARPTSEAAPHHAPHPGQ